MMLVVKAGERMTDEEGNVCCIAATNIHTGDRLRVDQFMKWEIPRPVPGDKCRVPFLKSNDQDGVTGVCVEGSWRTTRAMLADRSDGSS